MVQYQSPILHSLVQSGSFDVLQVEETLLAPYADSLPKGARCKTVLTLHNVHFVQAERIAAIEKVAWRRWWRRANARSMRHYEPATAARFNRVIAVSEADRELLLDAAPRLRVDVVPNGVDTNEMALLPEPKQKRAVLFVGTLSYRPCIDAAAWLVKAVLPILRVNLPSIEIWIVGKDAPPEVEALAGDGVFVESSVPDVKPYYRRASVAVAPLRAGGGSRLKILEAMSLGRPVVSTAIGAEGLKVRHEKNILIADEPEHFARSIALLLLEDKFRRQVVANARYLVEREYDWEAIADTQLEIYEELMGKN